MASLDLVGIIVRDMGESLKFYRLLGLEIPADADAEAHVEIQDAQRFPSCLGYVGVDAEHSS